jgi:ankyrin repeat protein
MGVMATEEAKVREALQQASKAATDGDLQAIDSILRNMPEVLRARDDQGRTLLLLACRAATGNVALPPVAGTPGQHAVVDRILAAGADPSAADNEGWSPLHAAATGGHTDLVRRLLAAGASREGHLLGTRGGSPLAIGLFYAQGAKLDAVLGDPAVPDNLRTAAALGKPIARFFEKDEPTAQAREGLDFYRPSLGFPVWERTCQRQELLDEALSWAARNDRCDAMAELVALGANVNANPYRGTPLLWAIYSDRVAAATWLLDHGADPDLRHDFGGAEHGKNAVAMHLAAQFDCVQCLRLLLDRGADPTIKDAAYGGTPLGWAEHGGAKNAIVMLKANQARGSIF